MKDQLKFETKNEEKVKEMGNFKEFCLVTSLEGWKYLYSKTPLWRMIWFIFLSTVCCFSIYNVYITVDQVSILGTTWHRDRQLMFH